MIGYIDAANQASLGAARAFGFRQVGYLPSVGYKFGHWTDTVMVQRSLGLGATAPPQGLKPFGSWACVVLGSEPSGPALGGSLTRRCRPGLPVQRKGLPGRTGPFSSRLLQAGQVLIGAIGGLRRVAAARRHDGCFARCAAAQKGRLFNGSPSRTRTCDHSINSRMLYQLSYRGTAEGRDIAEFGAKQSRFCRSPLYPLPPRMRGATFPACSIR